MSSLTILDGPSVMQGAYIPNVLNKKPSTAAALAQGIADLLYQAGGMSRREIKILLETLQAIGVVAPGVSIPKIISSLGAQNAETTVVSASSLTTVAQIPLRKFADNNDFLTTAKESLTPPVIAEAYKAGVYRTAALFYLLSAGAKGPQLETRKPTVRSWIDRMMQSLFGNNPPSESQRAIDRTNKLKGWSTLENTFPPPFTDIQKKLAIQLLKEHIQRLGRSLPEDSLIAENAVGFYFNQSLALTYDHFEELYQGIMTIRLKLDYALSHPNHELDLDSQEINKLSSYMNVPAGDIQSMIEEYRKDRGSEDQQKRIALTKNYLIILEYAHESLKIAYNEANHLAIHPRLAEFQAFHEGVIEASKRVMDGQYPNIEHGISTMQTPESPATGTSPTMASV
jgi:hypothetical protein